MNDNISKGKLFFTVLIVLVPILNQYNYFPLMIFDIISIFALLYSVLKKLNLGGLNIGFFFFLVYTIADLFIMGIFINGVELSSLAIRMIRVLVIYLCYYKNGNELFDYTIGYKAYTIIVYIISFVTIMQYIAYFLFRIDLAFLIPDAPLNYNVELSTTLMNTWHSNSTIGYFRPCSFFIEPAYQAQYMLPWMGIKLFSEDFELNKKTISSVIFVTLGMVLTTSSLAFLGSAIIWFLFTIKMMRKRRVAKGYIYGFATFVLLFVFLLSRSSIQEQLMEKFTSINSLQASSSFTLRLLRGIYCYVQMGNIQNIFGCGYGNIVAYFNSIHLVTPLDVRIASIDYMNGFSYALCDFGLIGFLVYIIFMIRCVLPRKKNGSAFGLIVVWMLLMLTASIFDTAVYFFIVVLFRGIKNIGNDKV